MKIYLDNNLGVEKVDQEELTQDTYGYNILKVYIPNAVIAPYDTFTCYYGALLQNGRKVGWFAMEARTNSDADYEANYTLYKATLEQCVVSVEGKVYIGCQVILGNSGNAALIKKNTAVVQFNVRKSVAINNDILILDPDQTNTDVLESYKQLLENALTTYATKAEVNSKLDLKADKSTTYTKTESDMKFFRLGNDNIIDSNNEFYGETKFFNDVYVDNFDIIQTRGGFSTEGNVEAVSFSKNGTGLDSIYASKDNTYTKTEVDSALSLKADKSNTYTKQEVNILGGDLQDQINSANSNISNLSTSVFNLGLDLDNLKSVQNVVDVVATYSALQSYDTSKLDVEDKVQVIADESHDGASTIYNWDGSAWQYIGAYGTNSYTKNEVDTKLSTKADKDKVYSIGQVENLLYGKADKSDTYTKSDVYTKTEVNDKLNGYIKNDDTTYSATVRGKKVVVSNGEGNGSITYGYNIHKSNPRKPSCDYSFPDEKSGTLALTSDIPTVNNPTITFTQGGTTKGSISLNQANDQTIALDAGGSGGGSSVVANPTLSGDEATLNGLEIDGTKYKVDGGSGTITLDDIVDKNGNKRFIEGEGISRSSGEFNTRYCRWSLSGTHLMCVLSATLRTNEMLPAGTLATFTVPDYIGRKIFTTWGNSITILEPYIKDMEGAGGNLAVKVDYANNNITFVLIAQISALKRERYFRIQFDLLIDSE